MTPNGYQRWNWNTPKSYWMIFISSICLNWDHYNPEIPSIHFLDSIFPYSLCFKKKKKNYPWVLVHIPECSFLCTNLLTCILLCSFCCNLVLVFKSSLCCKTWVLVFLYSFPCGHWLLVFLLHHLSSLISTSTHRSKKKNSNKKEKKHQRAPVLTEYTTRENLLLLSSTPFILFSSSCSPTSASSSPFSPSNLSSLCFPFFLLPCTSIISLSDFSYEICSLSESSPSMPASFTNATAILQMSFLMPLNSLRSSNFLKISAFHSTSVCCFNFLALDLLAVSTLAFAHALSVLKGLQAALALAQGAQEVVWLQKGISEERNNSNNTYSKFWGMQSILKSTHLSHRLPPPTTDIPISLANSSCH